MKLLHWIAVSCASLTLLTACGGGSGSTSTASTVSVTAVTTDQLLYRKVTNMTIVGKNLDLGINISNPGCLKITEVAGGSSTQRVFACKMIATGTIAVSITAGDNSKLYSGSLTIPLAAQPQVTMKTTLGDIVIELNPAKAPISVDNFLNYVENGFYVNKIFHRVVNSTSYSIAQGGGYTSDLQQPTPPFAAIKLESNNGLSNLRGTIGMARTSAVDSATSQFYFNVADNTGFDYTASNPGYAVFGKIVTGLDIMDKFKTVATNSNDVPSTAIFINAVIQTQ
ncbi:peptidylprolyl isomerase [Undibacterium sp. Jales W-56]|uniref:peptidylprolyl isomerase n=1 Tax=Undibacterium sp. Jales W-56 TaxID=2897325 RepID=UPI0021CF1D3A|nr:peptidylprolyl isomerase [Undibacterium sp. Jales W-56]MCU6435411.1 peptidylprolyl isomerase [Undibacterium sp. Jales W-56]